MTLIFSRHFDLKVRTNNPFDNSDIEPENRPLFVSGPLKMGLLLENSADFKIFDFTVDEKTEADCELDILKQLAEAKESQAKAKVNARTVQLERYLNRDERLDGTVQEFRGTFGFIRYHDSYSQLP
jgi:hypothetical protein